MDWNFRLLKKKGVNHLPNNNRNILLKLHQHNQIYLYLSVKCSKKKTHSEYLNQTRMISQHLLSQLGIMFYDQYYHKMTRILKYIIYERLNKYKLIRRSDNKQLRIDYGNGSQNIISLFAENVNLTQDGYYIPPGMEDLPKKIVKRNNQIIRNVFNDKYKRNRRLNI